MLKTTEHQVQSRLGRAYSLMFRVTTSLTPLEDLISTDVIAPEEAAFMITSFMYPPPDSLYSTILAKASSVAGQGTCQKSTACSQLECKLSPQ